MIGRTLSHYRFVEALGSGAMGDVYVADDTKLSGTVALEVLPCDLAEERLGRFEAPSGKPVSNAKPRRSPNSTTRTSPSMTLASKAASN